MTNPLLEYILSRDEYGPDCEAVVEICTHRVDRWKERVEEAREAEDEELIQRLYPALERVEKELEDAVKTQEIHRLREEVRELAAELEYIKGGV